MDFFNLGRVHLTLETFWRYRSDETVPTAGIPTKDTETLLRESLNLSTESYFGDPNLVLLNMDIKLQLSQEDFTSNTAVQNTKTSETISDYNISTLILRHSKFPLTIYSRRSQVVLDRQFADSLDSISTEHGASLAVNSDFMPSQFQIFHREHEQSGRFSGTDSKLVQDTFAWHGRLKPIGGNKLWWDYTFSSVDESGMIILDNSFTRQDAFVTHSMDYGSDQQHNLHSTLRLYKETGKFPIDRFRWNEILRLRHTSNFETKYQYQYEQQQRQTTKQILNRATASYEYDLFDSLTSTGEIGASQLEFTSEDFESTQSFGSLGVKYKKLVPKGIFFATANVSVNHQDDSDRGTTIQILNEPHTFAISGLIVISRRNVVVSSIVVTDVTGLIIYVEGADYTVRALGTSVEIQRILAGTIAPGQSVLVRYQIGPEPASSTDTLGLGMTARYRFTRGPLKGFSPFVRYYDQTEDRTGPGSILLPDNDFRDLVFGVDYNFWLIRLSAQHQIFDSSISPFDSTRIEGRYTQRLKRGDALIVSLYYQETDRVNDGIKTTITNLTGRWNTRPTDKLRSSLVGIYRREEDSSGGDSNAFDIKLDLTWQHRQTTIYCTLQNSILNSNLRDTTSQTYLFGVRRSF